MSKIVEATYQNGILILDQKLSESMEGKKIKLLIFEEDDIEKKKANFLRLADRHSLNLPDDYKFNREELYEE